MWWPVVSFTCGAIFGVLALYAMGKLPHLSKGGTIPTGRQAHEYRGDPLLCGPRPPVTHNDVADMISIKTGDLRKQVDDFKKALAMLGSQANRASLDARVALKSLRIKDCTKCDVTPIIKTSTYEGMETIEIRCQCTGHEGADIIATVETWNIMQDARKAGN